MKKLMATFFLLGSVALVAQDSYFPQKENAQAASRSAKTTKSSNSPKKKTSPEKKTAVAKTTAAPQEKKSEKKPESVVIPAGAYPIDRIEAVVFGTEATDIVTLSDVMRIGFDGKFHTKEDVIAERLIFQDALHYRITMNEEAVDEYMAKVAKSMGGTLDDIRIMFAQAGYTYEEGRRQFAIMYANNQLIDHKIRSRLIVPEHVVLEYYEANPIVKPASYMLERAFIPATPATHDQVKQDIEQFVKTGKGMIVTWYQLPEISQDDLAQDKQYLTKLKEGEIGAPQEINGGFEIFHLRSKVAAHPVPLEQRYRDIVEMLRRPKFDELLEEYKKELLSSASILYL